MQQVDKKNYQVVYIISFILVFFLIGCSQKNEYTISTQYFDQNITKDKILHAAKKVFILSDKDAFTIDAYRNDLNVTKSKATYRLYTMKIQNDHFDFNVDSNSTQKTIKASLSLYRTYGVDDKNPQYLDKESQVYTLFWDRIEYLLGKKKEWNSCSFYNIDGFLCDSIDLDDKSAQPKDILDLNITNYVPTVIEKIKVQTSLKLPLNKNNESNLLSDKLVLPKNKIIMGVPSQKDPTFDSYKINKFKDYNSTKYKQTSNSKNKLLNTLDINGTNE